MKIRDKLIIAGLILLLILLHRYLFQTIDGFFDESSDYTALTERLITELGPYCKVANAARDQLKTQLSSSDNPSDDTSLNAIYKTVYSCTDSMASSRQSCKLPGGLGPNTSMKFVSYDTYIKLPEWSDDSSVPIALMKITDDLPERIVREREWISENMKKVQAVIAAGENPPTTAPSMGDLNKEKEGFEEYCSADAIRAKKAMDEAKSCSIPDVASEIARINLLLDSPDLKKALIGMDDLYAEMMKLQSDLEKLKNGELYDWQKDPPKKSYQQFKGGDRAAAFSFSMKQNQ